MAFQTVTYITGQLIDSVDMNQLSSNMNHLALHNHGSGSGSGAGTAQIKIEYVTLMEVSGDYGIVARGSPATAVVYTNGGFQFTLISSTHTHAAL